MTTRNKTVSSYLRVAIEEGAGERTAIDALLPQLGLPQLDANGTPYDGINRLLAIGSTKQQVKALKDCQRFLGAELPRRASSGAVVKRAVQWPGISIHTAESLRTVHQRRSKRSASVTRALTAMKSGAALHLYFERGRPIWKLSTGIFVTAEVAGILTSNASVVPVGDALFADLPGQTWRFTDD